MDEEIDAEKVEEQLGEFAGKLKEQFGEFTEKVQKQLQKQRHQIYVISGSLQRSEKENVRLCREIGEKSIDVRYLKRKIEKIEEPKKVEQEKDRELRYNKFHEREWKDPDYRQTPHYLDTIFHIDTYKDARDLAIKIPVIPRKTPFKEEELAPILEAYERMLTIMKDPNNLGEKMIMIGVTLGFSSVIECNTKKDIDERRKCPYSGLPVNIDKLLREFMMAGLLNIKDYQQRFNNLYSLINTYLDFMEKHIGKTYEELVKESV
jgi:hypothetical protein